jgi:hypothetical protein
LGSSFIGLERQLAEEYFRRVFRQSGQAGGDPWFPPRPPNKSISPVVRAVVVARRNFGLLLVESTKKYLDAALSPGLAPHSRRWGLLGRLARTFITAAAKKIVEAGGSLRDVQQLAGHQNLAVTARYNPVGGVEALERNARRVKAHLGCRNPQPPQVRSK